MAGTTSPREPGADLYRRVLWLTAFRVATVTVLVGVTALLTFRAGQPLAGRMAGTLSALAVATNVLQIGVALLLRRRQWLQALAVTQIVGDVGFACVLVYLTGGHESLFSFMYLLVVVNGSILLAHRGAWLAAGLSLVADWAQLLGVQLRIIEPPLVAAGPRLATPELLQMLFVHGAAFALTATLSSYLAQLLERAGERATVAESSLSELHALHDSIVRSIASGILTVDADARITFLNRAAEDIVELPLSALRGRRIGEIFPAVEDALRTGRGPRDERLEAGWTSPSGNAKVLGFTVTPLLRDDGRRLGSAIVFQDLTPYRELELQAARSQRLAAVGKLAAGLAHELRNPLASISGSVELLASSPSAAPEDARLLGIVMREADRLSGLVSDFLAFARPAQPQLGPVDLPALVHEVLHVFEADPHFGGLVREEDLAPAVARADASQLKQVLWNLLLNAAQATPSGGHLRVTTGGADGRVFVAVADDGVGIGPEDLQRIFDPFFTTKPDGTGLGLATVHRIVDAHQGRLEVESRPGAGSRFAVFLPAHGEAGAEA